MRKITVTKVKLNTISVFNDQLHNYLLHKSEGLLEIRNTDKWLGDLLMMDIGQKLYYNLRNRIERMTKTTATLSFSVAEAIVAVQAIIDANCDIGSYEWAKLHPLQEELKKELLKF